MLIALLVPLGLAILFFLAILLRAAFAKRAVPNAEAAALGVVVCFFDTLGIGSFAPTTPWFKFRRLVPDRLIPPTMVVVLTSPVMAESIIFLLKLGVKVDPVLLFGSAVAVLVGGLIGAPLVARARVWIGTAGSVECDARRIIFRAIGRGASGMIVAHNHPSGDPRPNNSDIAATRRLADAARCVGICLYDHLVVAGHEVRSAMFPA